MSTWGNLIGEYLSQDPASVIFGAGLGYGTNAAYSIAIKGGDTGDQISFGGVANSGYLTMLLSFGILGLGAFVALIWSGLRRGIGSQSFSCAFLIGWIAVAQDVVEQLRLI